MGYTKSLCLDILYFTGNDPFLDTKSFGRGIRKFSPSLACTLFDRLYHSSISLATPLTCTEKPIAILQSLINKPRYHLIAFALELLFRIRNLKLVARHFHKMPQSRIWAKICMLPSSNKICLNE